MTYQNINEKPNFMQLLSLGFTKQQSQLLFDLYNNNDGINIIGGFNRQGKTTTTKTLLKMLIDYKNMPYKNFSSKEKDFIYSHNSSNIEISEIILTDKKEFDNLINKILDRNNEMIVFDEFYHNHTIQTFIDQKNLFNKILTTVLASNAISILDRFNYKNFLLSNKINALVFQKLVPILCPYCSQKALDNNHYLTHERLYHLNKKNPGIKMEKIRIRNENGCIDCKEGLIKREVCAEVIDYQNLVNIYGNKIQILIMKKDYKTLSDLWKQISDKNIYSDNMNGKTYIEHGIKKVIEGKLCIHDFWFTLL